MSGQSPSSDYAPVTLRVPFAAPSVASTRKQLKSWMAQHGGTRDDIEDARIVVSEIVGNAIRHARALPDGNLMISWTLEPRGLHLSVSDGGAYTCPTKLRATASAIAGRGMSIVDALTRSWWVEDTRSRSTVHAILALG